MTTLKEREQAYQSGYWAGYWRATVDHLGGKCVKCGETDPFKLEIHHPNGMEKRSRQRKDLKNLAELELQCQKCHPTSFNYRKRKKRLQHENMG